MIIPIIYRENSDFCCGTKRNQLKFLWTWVFFSLSLTLVDVQFNINSIDAILKKCHWWTSSFILRINWMFLQYLEICPDCLYVPCSYLWRRKKMHFFIQQINIEINYIKVIIIGWCIDFAHSQRVDKINQNLNYSTSIRQLHLLNVCEYLHISTLLRLCKHYFTHYL